jgi:hypothetical protein
MMEMPFMKTKLDARSSIPSITEQEAASHVNLAKAGPNYIS